MKGRYLWPPIYGRIPSFIVLFKFDNRYAGITFTKGAKAIGFDITAFFKLVVDGCAKTASTASVND